MGRENVIQKGWTLSTSHLEHCRYSSIAAQVIEDFKCKSRYNQSTTKGHQKVTLRTLMDGLSFSEKKLRGKSMLQRRHVTNTGWTDIKARWNLSKAVVLNVWSKDPGGYPQYFHANTKMLFAYFTFILLWTYNGVF